MNYALPLDSLFLSPPTAVNRFELSDMVVPSHFLVFQASCQSLLETAENKLKQTLEIAGNLTHDIWV